MIRPVLIAALAASCPLAPAPAQSVPHRVAVRHDDLNLSRPADVARLDRRIRRAAREACGPVSPGDLRGLNDRPACVAAATATAGAGRDRLVARAAPVRQASVR